MKRILIAAGVLISAAIAFSGVHQSNGRLSETLERQRSERRSNVQVIEELRLRLAQCQSRCQELKVSAKEQETMASAADELDGLEAGTVRLSAGQAEKLLAELGFNWESTGEYLIVSKDILGTIGVEGVREFQISDTACKLLAITPDERSALESVTQQLSAEYQSWLRSRIKREEPSGDILAKYSFDADRAFSQSQSNRFVSAFYDNLGTQRGELLLNYSRDWMMKIGMYDAGVPEKETTMVIRRQGKENYLMLDVNQSGSRMSCGLTRWQPFPEAFRSLFPGGWEELARREGFDLPDSFKKQ